MSKVNFLKMGMQNFLSYGNNLTEVDLDFTEPTLIVGQNMDSVVDGQIDSNGSGKTTIINALSFTLYGKPLSNILVKDLINNTNLKNMYTYVLLEKNGTYYKIERYRKNKSLGGDGIRILINDSLDFDEEEHDKTPDSINNSNAYIAETILEIPFEIFSRIVVFSAKHESFLSLPLTSVSGASQRSILEELFDFLELSDKSKTLKTVIKNNKAELVHLEEMQRVVESYAKDIADQYEDLTRKSKNWENERIEKISNTKDKIKELSKIDISSQKKLFTRQKNISEKLSTCRQDKKDLLNEIDKIDVMLGNHDKWKESYSNNRKIYTDELESYKSIDIEKEKVIINKHKVLEDSLVENQNELTKITSEIEKSVSEIEKYESELSHLKNDKCPYCLQDYMEGKVKKEELSQKISKLENSLSDLELQYKDIKKSVKNVKNEILEYNPNYTLSELSVIEKRIPTLEDNIKNLDKNAEEEKKFNYEGYVLDRDMKKSDLEAIQIRINDLEEKLSSVESKIEVKDENVLHEISTEIEVKTETLKTLENSENPYLDSIESLKEKKNDDNDKSDKINDLVDTIKHQEFLLKLINKNDSFIRKALLKENLPLLNERINYYLNKIGLPHHFMFDESLQCNITQFGKHIPHVNLSSGQQARVNIALSFAFRDILQIKHQFINICLLDEALDTGLGNVGVQLAANMIKNVAKENNMSMFVISHRDEASTLFNEVMSIVLKDGFSTIKKDG